MSPHKVIKLPPLRPPGNYRARHGHYYRNDHITVEGEVQASAIALNHETTETRKLHLTGSNYVYSGNVTQRKPQLLLYLEKFLDKELNALKPNEPKYQELKLQVYRDAFCFFIKEFKTYQPFLSAIKKEYDNALTYQEDQIREMEALRCHLRHVTEECNRKIQARWGEEQAEIGTLKKENEKLQNMIETQISNERDMQVVVDRLQSELSNMYLQYRDECDARKLLIWQLNNLTACAVKDEHSENKKSSEITDPVELQLALRVCRQDLTKAQEELSKMKAEYWDVVPRHDWDTLEQTHNQTLQQLKTLQGDFDLMKIEFDTLLEIYKKGSLQMEAQQHATRQVDIVLQRENQSQTNKDKEQTPNILENNMMSVRQVREAPKTSFPLKSDEEMDTLVASAQEKTDNTSDCIPLHELYSLPEESGEGTLPPDIQESQNTDTST